MPATHLREFRAMMDRVAALEAAGPGAEPLPLLTTVIESIGDFPGAVGNTITLPAGKYWISGVVQMGDTNLVMQKGAALFGIYADADQLVWTAGSGPRVTMVGTALDESYEFRNLTLIDALGSEDILAITGQPSNIIFRQSLLIGRGGAISASNLFIFDSSQLLNAERGFTFSGTCNFAFFRFSGVNAAGTNVGPLIEFGSSTWNRISILDVGFLTVAGQTAISGLASGANLSATGRAEVILSRFEGPGIALAGVTPDDVKWLFSNNSEVTNSLAIGDAGLANNSTATTATGVFAQILGTYTSQLSRRFTTSVAGSVTYIGLNPRAFQIDVNLLAEMDSGGPKTCSFQIFHTPIATGTPAGIGTPFQISVANQPTFTGLLGGIELRTGDILDVRLRNDADAVPVVVSDLKLLITAIPSGV